MSRCRAGRLRRAIWIGPMTNDPMKHIRQNGDIIWLEKDEDEFDRNIPHREVSPAEITSGGTAIWVNHGLVQRPDPLGQTLLTPREEVRRP